jgi:hypothetical protein
MPITKNNLHVEKYKMYIISQKKIPYINMQGIVKNMVNEY